MPKRREGQVKNKQTGYYFFNEYLGFPQIIKNVSETLIL